MSVVYFDQLLRAALLCIPISSWVLVIHCNILSRYLGHFVKPNLALVVKKDNQSFQTAPWLTLTVQMFHLILDQFISH